MRAAVRHEYGGPIQVVDVDAPVPGRGEVLIRVAAAGIDAGADHLMRGEPSVVRLGLGIGRPRDPRFGTEVAGTVEALGKGVTDLAVGDDVYGVTNGSFAEFVVAKAGKVARAPQGLDPAASAAAAVSGITALDAVRAAGLDSPGSGVGRRVLVTGAGGGVGIFAVQFAVAAGAQVTGVCSTAKVDLVRSLGAEDVVDYTAGEPSGTFDVVIDCGGRRDLRVLRDLLVPGGVAVLVGGEGGGGPLGGFERQLLAPLRMLGSARRFVPLTSSTDPAKLAALAGHLEAGHIRAVIDRRYPLTDTAIAMDHFAAGTVAGKLVLIP